MDSFLTDLEKSLDIIMKCVDLVSRCLKMNVAKQFVHWHIGTLAHCKTQNMVVQVI